jgi:signal transduction histidine kinase
MLAFGLYGLAIAALWPVHLVLPSTETQQVLYGAVQVIGRPTALLAGVQGLAVLAVTIWLAPRALDPRTKALLWPADPELAGRVRRLTQTRTDAVDAATAELRRVERDLHDGAQARLIVVGMSLGAAERLIPTDPQGALALVAEARETSSKALTELRDLVRGIYPPACWPTAASRTRSGRWPWTPRCPSRPTSTWPGASTRRPSRRAISR